MLDNLDDLPVRLNSMNLKTIKDITTETFCQIEIELKPRNCHYSPASNTRVGMHRCQLDELRVDKQPV